MLLNSAQPLTGGEVEIDDAAAAHCVGGWRLVLISRMRCPKCDNCDTGGGGAVPLSVTQGAGAGTAQSSADPRGVNIGSPAAPRCRVVTGPRPTVTWEGWSRPSW